MNEANFQSAGRLPGRIAIALIQGGVLWWLYRAADLDLWPGTDRGWLVGLVTPAILIPLAHYLTADLAPDGRRFWILPPLGFALFGFGWHHGAWTTNEPNADFFSFAIAVVVLVFHALPFVQVWLVERRWRPHYEGLFQFAWRNTLLVAFGGLFCGVFWLLLWLWGALFHMLGVEFFRDLFVEAYFAIPATTVAVGIGMQLAGSVERLQNVLRNTLLTMLKWLAPLAIFILTIFTLALVVKSPDLLLEQRRTISAAWLFWLVALTVALLNTAYQDGRTEAPYPSWLGRAIRYCVPLLLPVAILGGYALAVRVDAYGLTVARGWGSLVAVIALAYAVGYAWAALRKGRWMERMGVVNVAVALLSVLSLTLMLSPLLSPERLAANSQYARAFEIQEADRFRYLRFDSGEYGRAKLRELAALDDHPQAAAIRTAAQSALAAKHPYGRETNVKYTARDFVVFPQGRTVDQALLDALNAEKDDSYQFSCDPSEPCAVLFADLDRDGKPEALLFGEYAVRALRRSEDRWLVLNRSQRIGNSMSDRNSLFWALERGEFRVRDPEWQVLEIDGGLYVFDDAPAGPDIKSAPSGE